MFLSWYRSTTIIWGLRQNVFVMIQEYYHHLRITSECFCHDTGVLPSFEDYVRMFLSWYRSTTIIWGLRQNVFVMIQEYYHHLRITSECLCHDTGVLPSFEDYVRMSLSWFKSTTIIWGLRQNVFVMIQEYYHHLRITSECLCHDTGVLPSFEDFIIMSLSQFKSTAIIWGFRQNGFVIIQEIYQPKNVSAYIWCDIANPELSYWHSLCSMYGIS